MNKPERHIRLFAGSLVLVIVGILVSSLGFNGAGQVRAQADEAQPAIFGSFSWEYQLDFNDTSEEGARQGAAGFISELSGARISSNLELLGGSNYRLVMSGSGGMDEVRQVLFPPEGPNLIGGVAEIEMNMPLSSLQDIAVNLESNLSTGYGWFVVAAESSGLAEKGEAQYTPRGSAPGSPAVQTVTLKPAAVGNGKVKLVYRRSFEPNEPSTRHLRLNFAAQAAEIDLSDPHPQVVNKENVSSIAENPIEELPLKEALPGSFDWRTKGIVPAIRDQGGCGSCWAFGTVGVMESAIKKAGGPLPNLSEQFLVSCNNSGWSCSGGLTAHKYHYDTLGKAQTKIGAVLESAVPYTATNDTCTVAYNHPYKLTNWKFVTGSEWTVPTVAQIKTAIYTYGPITAAVCAGPAFIGYSSSGIFSTTENVCGGYTNHQIILVGWNNTGQYWILRNSWGTGWGENGYMKIKYNTSRVGEGTSWVKWVNPYIPIPISPAGTITDKTPTYKWSRLNTATKYQIQVYQGTTFVFSKVFTSGVCGTTTCQATPTNILGYKPYKWHVRAYIGGVWKPWSAFKNFTIAP